MGFFDDLVLYTELCTPGVKEPVVERVCTGGGKGVLPWPSEGVFSEAVTEADR